MESACKPGSVENDHSSRIAVTGDLKRPTRKHAGTRAATCVATSLFGLAPGGVCRAARCCHPRGALLPHRFTLASFIAEASAVCFLLHFPSAHAAQALPGTLSAGARTFLPVSRETQRSSGRLRGAPYPHGRAFTTSFLPGFQPAFARQHEGARIRVVALGAREFRRERRRLA